jgi:RHS repeat-associated protein
MIGTRYAALNARQHQDAYYPFGLPLDNNPFIATFVPNRFLYQGKEWQTALALNLYDFHARQYDPALGRWLAMDPQGQFASPYNGMGNNPVMMVDPDGELAWFVIPVIVGVVTGTINAVANYESGDNFWDVAGSFGVGFVAGAGATLGAVAIAPAATAALGTGFLGGAAIGATGGAISGFALGAGNTWLDGGSFGQGLANGFIGAGTGALIGGVTGGTFSGVKSVIQGRNFWTGAAKPIPIPKAVQSKGYVDLGNNKPPKPGQISKVNTNSAGTQVVQNADDPLNANGLRIGGQGDFAGKSIQTKPLTLSPKQPNHFGNSTIPGKSVLSKSPTTLLNDLNTGNFTPIGTNARGMPIMKFNYPIGNVIQQGTGANLGSTYYGTVHINSSGQVHIVPWLFR